MGKSKWRIFFGWVVTFEGALSVGAVSRGYWGDGWDLILFFVSSFCRLRGRLLWWRFVFSNSEQNRSSGRTNTLSVERVKVDKILEVFKAQSPICRPRANRFSPGKHPIFAGNPLSNTFLKTAIVQAAITNPAHPRKKLTLTWPIVYSETIIMFCHQTLKTSINGLVIFSFAHFF